MDFQYFQIAAGKYMKILVGTNYLKLKTLTNIS